MDMTSVMGFLIAVRVRCEVSVVFCEVLRGSPIRS